MTSLDDVPPSPPRLAAGGPAQATSQSHGLKVFLSYSRRDIEVAEQLVSRLEERGLQVLIDRRDLPYGEEWQKELADFIRTCDTVIWLVSPDSVASKWVNWELGEVGRSSKRLVPLQVREVAPETLPEALGRIHLLPAEGVFDFDRHLGPLVDTLNTNRMWLKDATRLADRARQWMLKDRDKTLLLHGRALADAEKWSSATPSAVPPIGSEILELLLHSQRAAVRRRRQIVVAALSLAVAGLGLALFSWQQRNAALANQSTNLASLSRDHLARGDAATSLLLAMSALPQWRFALDRPFLPEAGRSLSDAVLALREAKVLRGHDGDVNTVRFSSDGRLIVTASDDRTVRVWDTATGSVLCVIGPHDGRALGARFSPDDQLIVTHSEDANVHVWGVDGRPRYTLRGHKRGITSAGFLDTGTIVSTSLDRTARVWRLDTPDTPAVLTGHTSAVMSAAISHDGSRVVTSADDNAIRVWSRNGSASNQWIARTQPAVAAVLDSTGSRMARLSADNVVTIADLEGKPIVALKKGGIAIASLALCPAGRCLIATDTDGRAELWRADADSGVVELKGHRKKIMNVAIDPAGRLAATVSLDQLTLVWDLLTGDNVATLAGHEGEIFDASFSRSGELLATASRDRTARLWRIPAPTTTRAHTRFEARSMVVANDGTMAAFGGMDGTVRVLGGDTLETIASATVGSTPVTFVAFDRPGTRLLAGSESGDAVVYSLPRLEPIVRIKTDGGEVAGGGFEPSRQAISVLTTTGARYDVELPPGAGTAPRQSWMVTATDIPVAVFSPDLSRALIGRFDGQATVVQADGTHRELKGHRGAILHATFDQSGRRVATASEDGRARIWNAETGELLQQLGVFDPPVRFVALRVDGSSLATVSPDRTVKIWNFGDPAPVAIYRGHLGPAALVGFLPDTSGVLSASEDGAIHRWDFVNDYRAMLGRARSAVPRCLTADQATLFGLPEPSPDGCHTGR